MAKKKVMNNRQNKIIYWYFIIVFLCIFWGPWKAEVNDGDQNIDIYIRHVFAKRPIQPTVIGRIIEERRTTRLHIDIVILAIEIFITTLLAAIAYLIAGKEKNRFDQFKKSKIIVYELVGLGIIMFLVQITSKTYNPYTTFYFGYSYLPNPSTTFVLLIGINLIIYTLIIWGKGTEDLRAENEWLKLS